MLRATLQQTFVGDMEMQQQLAAEEPGFLMLHIEQLLHPLLLPSNAAASHERLPL